jgi:hypothetical protein
MATQGSDDLNDFSLLQGLNVSAGGAYAVADFADAEDSRPAGAYMEAFGGNTDAIQGIVQQSLQRHLTDATPPQTSPSLTSFNTQMNNWRKRLREMMIRQNETILSFLHLPSSDHAVVGPVERALRRYAMRQDIDSSQLKPLATLLADLSGSDLSIHKEIEERLKHHGPSNLHEIRTQVNSLIELYKETGEKLLECENQLKMRLEKMDKIQRRVSMVMDLNTNSALPPLIASLEDYLKVSFQDMGIESHYKSLIYYYKKHIALREAIQVFKTGTMIVNEPMCPICLSDSINTALTPCGHTFCTNCARRMTMECGVCRSRVRERMRLYFA